MMTFFNTILPSAIAIATVFLFGCTGEILTEKSGHLNLGIPGIMCCGTLGGCIGVSLFMSIYKGTSFVAQWFGVVGFGLLFSALLSLLGGLIYALLTITLKCNQNVTGLALTTFGAGLADFFMTKVDKSSFAQAGKIISTALPFANDLGVFGKIFFSYGILVYLAIAIAIITAVVLKKTRVGLSLRAVGESPATADAAGINTTKYKYVAVLSGSVIAGFGGLFYVMDYLKGSWNNSSTIQAFGWLAIALVIFSVWKPALAILGSIIFGLLYILPNFINNISFVQMNLLSLVPYVVTIIVLIFTSIFGRKSVQPPASLGQSYFREER